MVYLPLFANCIFAYLRIVQNQVSLMGIHVFGNVTLEQQISTHRFCIELKLVKRIRCNE